MRTATPFDDLLEDHRRRPVGDVGGDLDAAVHRPRVHHDRVRPASARRSGVSPKSVKYSRSDGKKWPCIRSMLDAQHHHHVGVGDARPRRASSPSRRGARCRAGSASAAPTRQTSRPACASRCTFERSTRLCSRSPMIATFRPARRSLCSADREGVEQRLRRVLVHAVAGVDDARRGRSATAGGGARRRVPHHDHVRRHRLEVERGVDQRLALGRRSRSRRRCSACRR